MESALFYMHVILPYGSKAFKSQERSYGPLYKTNSPLALWTVFSSLIESDACRFLWLRKLKLLFLI